MLKCQRRNICVSLEQEKDAFISTMKACLPPPSWCSGEENPAAWPNFHACIVHVEDLRTFPTCYAIYAVTDAFGKDSRNEYGWVEGI
jgi:hypothetical protein